MDVREIKQFARQWAADNRETYYRTARFIWENPELSMQEFKSQAALRKVLGDEGFQIEEGAGGMPTAFIASYGSGRPVSGYYGEIPAVAPGELIMESG
ncbi:MAG: hypothetical protein LBG27_08105 [Spirochaetaceae bacterium]|jgi:aminobenzoyl-glutamate utilization protein B|nr:hypothetical protein [Spirochaetaceae bacterium]